ncbi:MAG: bifunctional adenosylcobinamide kinase/adenosylcobinamide-phosphate guanylyltransferase [Oscillospiraceae bacterium]|nr:bifunctional adenosylcobinamide kinase/adenosylcobinamide-phosphate guanylyltransferase [Oscillospiraceae bacterium]
MRIYISGGAKNGKSMFAQEIAKKLSSEGHLWYLATMEPHDDEDLARIARHRDERAGWGFRTAEWGRNIALHCEEIDCKGTYLVDSVTALLSNEMFSGMSGEINKNAADKTAEELLAFSEKAENVVFVSDNIFCDAAFYDEWTDSYREGLAKVDRTIAEKCDVVAEFSCGQIIFYKGAELI